MPRTCARQQEKPPQQEVRVPQLESSPVSAQLETACMQQWRPARPKINKQTKCVDVKKQTITSIFLKYFWVVQFFSVKTVFVILSINYFTLQ